MFYGKIDFSNRYLTFVSKLYNDGWAVFNLSKSIIHVLL